MMIHSILSSELRRKALTAPLINMNESINSFWFNRNTTLTTIRMRLCLMTGLVRHLATRMRIRLAFNMSGPILALDIHFLIPLSLMVLRMPKVKVNRMEWCQKHHPELSETWRPLNRDQINLKRRNLHHHNRTKRWSKLSQLEVTTKNWKTNWHLL